MPLIQKVSRDYQTYFSWPWENPGIIYWVFSERFQPGIVNFPALHCKKAFNAEPTNWKMSRFTLWIHLKSSSPGNSIALNLDCLRKLKNINWTKTRFLSRSEVREQNLASRIPGCYFNAGHSRSDEVIYVQRLNFTY